jgi:ParB family transcriptional regulator, chromosome partitioning protein
MTINPQTEKDQPMTNPAFAVTGRTVEITDMDENIIVSFMSPDDLKTTPSTTTTTERTTTMTTDTTTLPLNSLTAWQGNVRKTNSDTGLDELAASITAHGLLQSLVVRKDRKGKHAVIAGRRRFLALTALAKAGTIPSDMPVPCHVLAGNANATEISLTENTVREQMHPADEFDAFLALIDTGTHPADIAARFGVTETVVQQRLKLARVSPIIVAAYREDKIALAHVMAFSVTDDHAAQERVWNELEEWQLEDPGNIRDALTVDEITAKNRHVKFVTLKAYEKAGGAVRRDLFAQDDDGVFIQDIVLLESLVAKKLEKTAAAVRKEGWKWVEIRPSFDYSEWSKCERRYPEAEPLPADLQAELDALNKEYEELNDAEWEGDGDQENPRLDEIIRRTEEIEDREKSWQPETLAVAGAVVTIGGDGKADIHYGYVKPEDAPKKPAKTKTVMQTDEDGTVTEIEVAETSALSASLTESLTAHQSAAISATLKDSPLIALAAVVHGMVWQVFFSSRSRATSLQITATSSSLSKVQNSTPFEVLEQAREQWGEQIPGSTDDLWTWCLEQPQDVLLDLLAFCAACTVNAVQVKADRPDGERLVHARQLGEALNIDMAKWFRPTAENYFGKISKAGIIEALCEIKGGIAPAWNTAKKLDLAAMAEREVANTNWLPALLKRPA